MEHPESLERLERWCDIHLGKSPNSQGLLETKALIKYFKKSLKERSRIKNNIVKVINIVEEIKVGNTPKYQSCKDNVIAVLTNVLNSELFKSV